MAGETVITVIGNLTADPELKFTNNGVALANFTVASTPKVWDRKANEMKDGEPLFLRCTAWRELAENAAQSLTKGARVVVVGNLTQRNYEHEGQKRTSFELMVDEVAPSLRWATAQVSRSQRGNSGSGGSSGSFAQPSQGGSISGSQNDGWHNPGQSFNENEAPF